MSFTFQSTHPRGVRLNTAALKSIPNLFQSTHPRGARPEKCKEVDYEKYVSIHAPTRGATRHSGIVMIALYGYRL